jgi:surface antigen
MRAHQVVCGVSAVLVASALVLGSTSCATHEQSGALTGAGIGAVAGNVLTGGSLIGTLVGGAVGAAVGSDVGRQLDEVDRLEAAYALEHSPTGGEHEWVNPDSGRAYSLEPTRTFEGPEGPCREFVLWTRLEGEPAEVRGIACRGPDGMWRTREG